MSLQHAVVNDNWDLAKYLASGKRTSVKGAFYQMSLYHAARSGNLGSVLYLVEEKGVDINARDVGGETLLHYAAKSGNLELVKYLVEEKGADVNARDMSNKTPIRYAAEGGNLDLVKYFAGNVQRSIRVKLREYAQYSNHLR
ncbi:ankyrin repeat domain protein [Wolbachia endosymbiont of Armadillidium vulgare str. wVulC]|uniref:ankyrin repeat domain-containing protein n=1 Tax=Wolbachia endosymbiont of Armadillidium vulgare TaxID=77039 RepID=UPI0006D4C437|nr:ankyrin repeat domain-containing protein [Wolbachia endosymbiont of Armadillidium vulgare]KLT21596.1 ankyrin repeat domain protein [Wolbachia endosymbiont of Armadillidium vulgare str. wVulC]